MTWEIKNPYSCYWVSYNTCNIIFSLERDAEALFVPNNPVTLLLYSQILFIALLATDSYTGSSNR